MKFLLVYIIWLFNLSYTYLVIKKLLVYTVLSFLNHMQHFQHRAYMIEFKLPVQFYGHFDNISKFFKKCSMFSFVKFYGESEFWMKGSSIWVSIRAYDFFDIFDNFDTLQNLWILHLIAVKIWKMVFEKIRRLNK